MTVQPNPFSSRFIRPGAVSFRSRADVNMGLLLQKLEELGWRAQILGPHGCGKSTLLESLKSLFNIATCQVTLRSDASAGDNFAQLQLQTNSLAKDELLIVDGIEQLDTKQRDQLFKDFANRGTKLLVTCHHSVGLPTLIELKPDIERFRELVEQLLAGYPIQLTSEEIEYAFQKYSPNIREALFSLYDVYESKRRKRSS